MRGFERKYTSIPLFTDSYIEVPRLQGLRSQNQYFVHLLINLPKISQLARGSFWAWTYISLTMKVIIACWILLTLLIPSEMNAQMDHFPACSKVGQLPMANNTTVFFPVTLWPWTRDNLLGEPTLSFTTRYAGKISNSIQTDLILTIGSEIWSCEILSNRHILPVMPAIASYSLPF